ncbi:MAG: hypothetical protein QW503_00485 [Sulfolobales archaeon]
MSSPQLANAKTSKQDLIPTEIKHFHAYALRRKDSDDSSHRSMLEPSS